MQESDFYADGVTRVVDALKTELGTAEYTYFDDELLDIPQESLPCIMVFEGQGGVRTSLTMTDDIGETITIIVALNLLDDVGATEDTMLTGRKLRHIVKGQDPTTKEWSKGTIMRALRQNFTLGDATVLNEIEIDFSPNQRGDNVYTKEAYITLRIERMATVPQRT